MIQKETALALIASKKQQKIIENDFSSFSEKYKVLGSIICGFIPKIGYYRDVHKELKLYKQHFGEDAMLNPFLEKEGKQLILLIFGSVISEYIPNVWNLLNTSPYQMGYARRSFRIQPSDAYTTNKFSVLTQIFESLDKGFKGMDIKELIRFNVYFEGTGYEYIFAVIFSERDPEIRNLVKDILQSEDEIGGVSRSILKGLLLSDKEENWKLVADLLIAAQRQEGLRQTILEVLDETHLGALHYFITIILQHDLMRFSSVIRAVNCWFGFGWEAPKKTTVKRVLEISASFFENSLLVAQALKSNDNLEVYIALWYIGLTDVDQANLHAVHILEKGCKEKKLLACMFINTTGRSSTHLYAYVEANFGADVEVDYWLLKNVFSVKIKDDLFCKIYRTAKSLPSKGTVHNGQVFLWSYYKITPNFFYDFTIANSQAAQLELLAQNISELPSESREKYMRVVFPNHFNWSVGASSDKITPIKLSDTSWEKQVMYQGLNDRNISVLATSLRVLKSIRITPLDMLKIEGLLAKKNKEIRTSLISLVLAQDDLEIKRIVEHIVVSKKIDQRLAGLEIISKLIDHPSFLDFNASIIQAYMTRAKIIKNEQLFIDKFEGTVKEYHFKNGFGLINYKNISPLLDPKLCLESTVKKGFIERVFATSSSLLYPAVINIKKLVTAINDLVFLLAENKNYEYQYHDYYGAIVTTILEKEIEFVRNVKGIDAQERLQYLPLPDV